MTMLTRRWRHKFSPSARRGREAARKFEAAREYATWVSGQQALTQGRDQTAADAKQ